MSWPRSPAPAPPTAATGEWPRGWEAPTASGRPRSGQSRQQGYSAWMESAMDFMACRGVRASGRSPAGDQPQRRGSGEESDRHGFHVEKARRQGLDRPSGLRGRRGNKGREQRRSGVRAWRRTPSPSATCSTTAISRSATSPRSSRGPTGDGRMKPNVVAPGNTVTSAERGPRTVHRQVRHQHGHPARHRARGHAHGALPGVPATRRCCGPT